MKRTIVKKSELKKLILETIKELNVIDYIKAADDAGDDTISGPGVSLAKGGSFIYFAMVGGGHPRDISDNLAAEINVAKVKSVSVGGEKNHPELYVKVTSTRGGGRPPLGPRELGPPENITFIVHTTSATRDTPSLLIQAHEIRAYTGGAARVVFYSEDDAKKFIEGVLSVASADAKDIIQSRGNAHAGPMSDPSSLQYVPSGASKKATRAYKAIKSL